MLFRVKIHNLEYDNCIGSVYSGFTRWKFSYSFVLRHESSSRYFKGFITITKSWIYRNHKLAQLRIKSLVFKPNERHDGKWQHKRSIATTRAHAELNSQQCRRARFTGINSLRFSISNIKLGKPTKSSNIVLQAKSWMKIFELKEDRRNDQTYLSTRWTIRCIFKSFSRDFAFSIPTIVYF